MLRVSDIMTPNVVTISPEATLRVAIDTLVTVRIGGAPVSNQGRIVGVLSATDVLQFESAKPVGLRAESPDRYLETAEEANEEAPSTLLNLLWSGDEATVSERRRATSGAEWDFLEHHTVAEAMSRSVCSVSDDLEVSAAAQRMLAYGVQRALVMRSGTLVGILTTTDILRAVAEHRLTREPLVFS
jgi:CBS domain-containing protein